MGHSAAGACGGGSWQPSARRGGGCLRGPERSAGPSSRRSVRRTGWSVFGQHGCWPPANPDDLPVRSDSWSVSAGDGLAGQAAERSGAACGGAERRGGRGLVVGRSPPSAQRRTVCGPPSSQPAGGPRRQGRVREPQVLVGRGAAEPGGRRGQTNRRQPPPATAKGERRERARRAQGTKAGG